MEEIRIWMRQAFSSKWEPPVDVWEDDEAYHIIVDVAGVNEQDLEVNYYPDGRLVVHGTRRFPITNAVQCLVLEIPYGTFERNILLPLSVEPDTIVATYKAGLLNIRVPKVQLATDKLQSSAHVIRIY